MAEEARLYRRLFLHFFDLHFLEAKGATSGNAGLMRNIAAECRRATRLALLSADEVLVPASSFYESRVCHRILRELESFYGLGIIRLVASAPTIGVFAEQKLSQYDLGSEQYKAYQRLARSSAAHPPLVLRERSATADITEGWISELRAGRVNRLANRLIDVPPDFEDLWSEVPERLQGRAFIVEYVAPLIGLDGPSATGRLQVHDVINKEYFDSYLRELGAGVVSDLLYLDAPFALPSYGPDLPYKSLLLSAKQEGLLRVVDVGSEDDLFALRSQPAWSACVARACDSYEQKVGSREAYMDLKVLAELRRATVGVITALPKEFNAVRECLGATQDVVLPGQGAGRRYSIGVVKSANNSEHRVAVVLLPGAGNNSAAIRAAQMLGTCPQVRHLLMVGIAGAVPDPSRPEHHVRLGDIVVSNEQGVIQYDYVKKGTGWEEHRNPPRPPSAKLLEAVRWLATAEERGERPWDAVSDCATKALGPAWARPMGEADLLRDWDGEVAKEVDHPADPDRVDGLPRVFQGPIASANVLLKDPILRDQLRDQFQVKAIEMEGSGVADAAWDAEIGYLVVRGTCDYCNPDKGDFWQKHAAVIAAAYTRSLLEALST